MSTSDQSAYQVYSRRSVHGLELHVVGVGVTQTHEDDDVTAEQMVASYLSAMFDRPADSFQFTITPLPHDQDVCIDCAGIGNCRDHTTPECDICADDGECPYCCGTGITRSPQSKG